MSSTASRYAPAKPQKPAKPKKPTKVEKAELWLRNYGKRYPPFVPFMACITVVYLAFELGFNARLLDVTGGMATHVQVDHIEKWGRCISGVALTLAVWGIGILPRAYLANGRRWNRAVVSLALTVSAVVIIRFVYVYERKLVDYFVYASSGAERRAAAQLEAVSAAVLRGDARIEGIDLSGAQMSRPAGKAFLSVFPLVALSTPDLKHKTESMLRDAVRLTIVSQVGTTEKAYNAVFIPSVGHLRDSYRQYRDGCISYGNALNGIPDQQNQAWQNYVGSLARRGRTPYNVPGGWRARVGNDVRAQGVPVPEGWDPADRGTFYAVLANRIREQAQNSFNSQTANVAGHPLPYGMSWNRFVAEPSIQDKWASSIGAPQGVELAPLMGFLAYRDRVYAPIINKQTDDRMRILLRPDAEFGDGGAEEIKGRDAMEALVVPPIALGFSLCGAMLHIFKSIKFFCEWSRPLMKHRRRKIATPLLLVFLSMLALPNSVSSSDTFAFFQRQTRSFWNVWGWPMSAGILWTVQAQPFFYPANEAVRRYLVFGLTYGYVPPEDSR